MSPPQPCPGRGQGHLRKPVVNYLKKQVLDTRAAGHGTRLTVTGSRNRWSPSFAEAATRLTRSRMMQSYMMQQFPAPRVRVQAGPATSEPSETEALPPAVAGPYTCTPAGQSRGAAVQPSTA